MCASFQCEDVCVSNDFSSVPRERERRDGVKQEQKKFFHKLIDDRPYACIMHALAVSSTLCQEKNYVGCNHACTHMSSPFLCAIVPINLRSFVNRHCRESAQDYNVYGHTQANTQNHRNLSDTDEHDFLPHYYLLFSVSQSVCCGTQQCGHVEGNGDYPIIIITWRTIAQKLKGQ